MQIKGVSVENTLDLAVFGDILVWVATFLGLVPWDKLFVRKKDFQEQLAEFSDDFHVDDIPVVGSWTDSVGGGQPVHEHDERLATNIGTTEQVLVPGGIVYHEGQGDLVEYVPGDTLRELAPYQAMFRRF